MILRSIAVDLTIATVVCTTGLQNDLYVSCRIMILQVKNGTAETVADQAAELRFVQAGTTSRKAVRFETCAQSDLDLDEG